MSPVDTLLNQLRYVNRTRVKADVDAVTQEYRTLIPRIVDFGKHFHDHPVCFEWDIIDVSNL